VQSLSVQYMKVPLVLAPCRVGTEVELPAWAPVVCSLLLLAAVRLLLATSATTSRSSCRPISGSW
jgi:hypothetical protein